VDCTIADDAFLAMAFPAPSECYRFGPFELGADKRRLLTSRPGAITELVAGMDCPGAAVAAVSSPGSAKN
jgi:hypothetical protein